MQLGRITRSKASPLTRSHVRSGATQWEVWFDGASRKCRLYVRNIADGWGECYIRAEGEEIAVSDDAVSMLGSVQVAV